MTKQLSHASAQSLSTELNPNASRLRDNQRRSRARKKEYLASLEAKVAECQRTGVEASIEIQNAARAVVKENQRLKELLRKVGLSDSDIDAWIVEGGLDPAALDRVQRGLGPRMCPGVVSDRPSTTTLVRRGSTGGLPGKIGDRPPPPQRRASMMPNNNNNNNSPLHQQPLGTGMRSPPLRPVPGVSSPLAQPELRVFTMYPTPTTTGATSALMTPTSATPTSPYGHGPLGSPSFFTNAPPTTSPPILPGAITGWNNFPINPQLPPPAMPPAVLSTYMAAAAQHHAQRHAQHASQQQARAFFTGDATTPRSSSSSHHQHLHHHQQQQQQQSSTTPCDLASQLISQFHPSGYAPADLVDEICPPRGAQQHFQQHQNQTGYAQQQQQQQQQQQTPPQQHHPQQQSPQGMPQNSNGNEQGSVQAAVMQIASSNGVTGVNNNSLNVPSASTSQGTISGLLHQNSMNSRQQNPLNNASSPYGGGGSSVQMPSPGSSSTMQQQAQPNHSPFQSPTPSSNNPPQTSHGAIAATTNHMNSASSPVMSNIHQPTLSGDGDTTDTQSSVQKLIQEMMMNSQMNGGGMMGIGSMGSDAKNVSGILPISGNSALNGLVGNGPTSNNSSMSGGSLGGIGGGLGQASMVNGIRAALGNNSVVMNGRVGMASMARDQSVNHQQQDLSNQMLSGLGAVNGFNNLQFDWKPSP